MKNEIVLNMDNLLKGSYLSKDGVLKELRTYRAKVAVETCDSMAQATTLTVIDGLRALNGEFDSDDFLTEEQRSHEDYWHDACVIALASNQLEACNN